MSRSAWRIAFLASLLAFLGLAAKLFVGPGTHPDGPLLVYCAAGLRQPVEAAVKAYGTEIQLQFGGSQTLLGNLEITRKGDLYIPADESYLRLARSKNLTAESIPLATMRPVLAVPKGNPKGIRSVEDLAKPDMRIAQANPDAAAVGKLVRDDLQRRGQWTGLQGRIVLSASTVNEVANALKIGSVDAGFVWDATVKQYPELERVEGVGFDAVASVPVAVLKSSTAPAAALRFARFLAARDRGLQHFAKSGFDVVEGDVWEEKPQLLLYSGAMLRPAIEKTVTAFEEREGCTVTRVYNGCGILVGQMQTGAKPDVYFACDTQFMAMVKERFPVPLDVSLNQLVILVPKGNPRGIKTLKDMGQPGLRVGVGHEKQCALGQLTQETLRQSKLEKEVMKNVVVQTPTGDMLVNQLRTGSLDAVIAYVSNAASAADALEAFPVDIPCALAVQPVAIAKDASRRHLAARLVDALRSAESRARFEAEGFKWRADESR